MSDPISLAVPDIEQLLVAASIQKLSSYFKIEQEGIRESDFNNPTLRLLYEHVHRMVDDGRKIDKALILNEISTAGHDDFIPDGLISELVDQPVDHDLVPEYCRIVKDRSLRRSLRDGVDNIVQLIYTEPDVKKLVEHSEGIIYNLGNQYTGKALKGFDSKELAQLYNKGQATPSKIIPFPFASLNKMHDGGRKVGCLTIFGAYTSDGKSVVALQSVERACAEGHKVGLFTLEMTEEEVLQRLVAMKTGYHINNGQQNFLERDAIIQEALDDISKWDLKVFADPNLTPEEIRSIQVRESFDFIVVDYLQRFHFVDWKEIPAIAKQFKNLALSSRCSVDLLSQLTPIMGSDPFPRPTTQNLYGGKATSNEANNVIFIYPLRDRSNNYKRTGVGTIINAKSRGGVGEFEFAVEFDPDHIMWREL